MSDQIWVNELKKTLVCVDSYEDGVLKGRLCSAYRDMEAFSSTMQFLLGMESVLEETQTPQSFTSKRCFSDIEYHGSEEKKVSLVRKGAAATFELSILFRQHSSWQGSIVWKEKKREQSFRSVLELLILMDSALRVQQ